MFHCEKIKLPSERDVANKKNTRAVFLKQALRRFLWAAQTWKSRKVDLRIIFTKIRRHYYYRLNFFIFANIGSEQDTPREGCLHVSHFRIYFLINKTEDKAVLVVNKQIQGSSTFNFTGYPKNYFYRQLKPCKSTNIRNQVKLFKIKLLYDRKGFV